jgi:hypothetical protein
MGRKRIPKNQRREVISISLKPATIDLIDSRISHSQSRSVFVEKLLLNALKSMPIDSKTPTVMRSFWCCQGCDTEYSKITQSTDEILCRKCNIFIPLTFVEEAIL